MGQVTPLFLKEDNLYADNYRPVTVLPILNTLLRQTEDWRTSLDNEELVTVISSDLSKAFDCMCTTRVGASLRKVEGVWSSQHVVLLQNYWSGRSQS